MSAESKQQADETIFSIGDDCNVILEIDGDGRWNWNFSNGNYSERLKSAVEDYLEAINKELARRKRQDRVRYFALGVLLTLALNYSIPLVVALLLWSVK